MAEAYGHKWSSQYGPHPAQAWIDHLSDLTVDEVKRGLCRLKDFSSDDGWPPTVFEFKALCRPSNAPSHEMYQALPAPTSSPEARKSAAEKSLAEIRAMIGKHEDGKPQGFQLTPEERAQSDALDWDRIRQVAAGAL